MTIDCLYSLNGGPPGSALRRFLQVKVGMQQETSIMGWWGGSHCCPGEFLAVDLSGRISRCRLDLSGGISLYWVSPTRGGRPGFAKREKFGNLYYYLGYLTFLT